jgi:hypothetical protein
VSPLEPVSSRFIGDPRLQRLLVDTGGDLARAHELFEWNVHAAGAAMEAIHVFELILRNAIDRELRIWNDAMAGTPDWSLRPHPYLLRALNQTELANAVTRARRMAEDAVERNLQIICEAASHLPAEFTPRGTPVGRRPHPTPAW